MQAVMTLIIGESGTGKSTSIETLNPNETLIINVIDKPLPFRGFRKDYKILNSKEGTGNYFSTDKAETIKQLIKYVNDSRPEIKNIIVDDFQYIMCNEYMRRAMETGFQKFSEIAHNSWAILTMAPLCRGDLSFFFLAHSAIDDHGKARCKTIGKLLDEKIDINGLFTIVLHSLMVDGHYHFLTQNDGSRIAKSPKGMFDTKLINNDLGFVRASIDNYYS